MTGAGKLRQSCASTCWLVLVLIAGCWGTRVDAAPAQAASRQVAVIGDGRTAAEPRVPGSAGWGDAISLMWRHGVTSRNYAVPDATLVSFLNQGNLDRVLEGSPAFVLIGFGQGDADAGTKLEVFEKLLDSLVMKVQARGSKAVLVTPPVLRRVEPLTGKAMSEPAADAKEYVEAIERVAKLRAVPCVDLWGLTGKSFKEYGDRANWFLHPPVDMSKEPKSLTTVNKKRPKPTPRQPAYFSETGADSLAQAIAVLMREQGLPLAKDLRPVDGPPSDEYQLVWRDEFKGQTLEGTDWKCRYPGVRKDGINDPACLRLDGEGHLVIDVKRVGDKVHSAMVSTREKKEWKHGYFECRMNLPTEPGMHAAFWLTSDRMASASNDPAEVDQTRRNGTEIDVMEYFSGQGDVVHFNLHWNGYRKDVHRSSPFDVWVPRLRQDRWHVYGVEWTTDGYTFYVDGRRAWSTTDAPSDLAQYVILSVEISKWAGDIARARLPQEVKFDWVRVWQKPSQIKEGEQRASQPAAGPSAVQPAATQPAQPIDAKREP